MLMSGRSIQLGHQCSSPTSYIYYAESVMEPVNALHEFLAPVSMHLGVIAVCLRKAANAKFLLVLSCEHVGAHHLLEELIDLRMHSFTHVRGASSRTHQR